MWTGHIVVVAPSTRPRFGAKTGCCGSPAVLSSPLKGVREPANRHRLFPTRGHGDLWYRFPHNMTLLRIPTHSISHNPQTPRRQRQRSALSQLPSSSSSETPQTHDPHYPPSARRANHPNFHPDTHTRWGLVKVKKRNWGFGRSVSGRHEGQEKGSVGGRKPRGRCRW